MKRPKYKLILASGSPRRRKILKTAGFTFRAISPNSSESFSENLSLNQNLTQIVKRKLKAAKKHLNIRNDNRIFILSADTIVCVGSQVLGKPKSKPHARRMLRLLSGREHMVRTAFGVSRLDSDKTIVHIVKSKVGFRKLSETEIERYINTQEPYDKAGAYAVQGKAADFIKYVKGDLLNVMGLPLKEVCRVLAKQGLKIESRRKTSFGFRKNKTR